MKKLRLLTAIRKLLCLPKKIPPLKAIEVAKRKNVSAATVTRWMKREIDPLPAKRNGGLVRIEVDDLEEWYDRNFI